MPSILDSVPLCSIVVPVYNNCFYTRLCLEALRRARPRDPSYELILVDNGSTDATGSLLAEFSADLGSVIRNETNLGFAAAANKGAAAARGEYLVFLNNDVLVEPGWLRALVAFALGEGDVGAVGGRLLYPDGTIQHAGVVFGPDGHPHNALAGHPGDGPEALDAKDCQAVTGACLLIKKDLFLSLGGFDESYANSFEDVDLCLKVRRAGWRIRYCPQALAYHFESSTPGRFLRDDRNLSLLLSRWGKTIVADYDPAKTPLHEAKGEASLMRLELESVAARARHLAAERDHLRRLLEEGRPENPAIPRREYDLVYRPGRPPPALAGCSVTVPVALINQGQRAWPPGSLRLSYHWRKAAYPFDRLIWDGLRTILEEALEPGQAASLSAMVRMPETPGAYVLEWDAVEEGVAWMSERGVVPYRQLVTVHQAVSGAARIDGLPAIANAGQVVKVTAQLEQGPDGLLGPFLAWRWAALDGQENQGPWWLGDMRLPAPEASLHFSSSVPTDSGRYKLEIGYLLPDGLWLSVETLGGQVSVLPGGETAPPTEAAAAPWPSQEGGKDRTSSEALSWQRLVEEDGYWLARAGVERERQLVGQVEEERHRAAQFRELVEGFRRGKVMRLLALLHRLPFRPGRG